MPGRARLPTDLIKATRPTAASLHRSQATAALRDRTWSGTDREPGGHHPAHRPGPGRGQRHRELRLHRHGQVRGEHWKNCNPDYRKFNDVGGDCTNFISQAPRTGGRKNDTGWYKSHKNWWCNSSNRTTSWINVDYWASFALHGDRAHNLDNVHKLGIGDILQRDFGGNRSMDHSMITTYKSNGVPYLTHHSTNTYRKSVKSLVAQYPRAPYYAFRT